MSRPFFDARRRQFLGGAAAGFLLAPAVGATPARSSRGELAWTFYRSGSTEAAPVFADAAATTPLGNRVASDASGRFPPVFLPPGRSYRAVLTQSGSPVAEIDPVEQLNAAVIRYSPEGQGAVARPIAAKLGERVSVLDFGADPSGRADSAAAIEAAIAYAHPRNRELYFPAGIYTHSRPLAFGRPGFSVRGEGYCVLRHTGRAGHCVSVDAGPAAIQYGVRLENLVIEGSGAPGQNGLWIRNWARSALRDIMVRDVTGQAFRLEGVVQTHFDFCRVAADLAYRHVPTHSWFVTGSGANMIGATTNCVFTNCMGKVASQYGLYLERCDACSFHGGGFEGLPGVGIHIGPPCTGNAFLSVFAEENGGGDIVCHGSRNIFTGVTANSRARQGPYVSLRSMTFRRGANGNIVIGGQAFSVAVEAGAEGNELRLHTLAETYGESGIADAGTRTRIER
jgi:hypothetical protein